jgi:hypothetical protein
MLKGSFRTNPFVFFTESGFIFEIGSLYLCTLPTDEVVHRSILRSSAMMTRGKLWVVVNLKQFYSIMFLKEEVRPGRQLMWGDKLLLCLAVCLSAHTTAIPD